MAIRKPLVLINGRPSALPVGDTLPLSLSLSNMIDIIGFQFVPITTTGTSDTLIPGSDFVWHSTNTTTGQKVYLESVAYGSLATTTTTTTLYTIDGTAVPGSATTTGSTTPSIARSTGISLTDGATYQVRWKINMSVVTASTTLNPASGNLKTVRLIISNQ